MDELRQRFPFSFLDLELAFFQAALWAHKGLLSQAKQKALENFVADLEPMVECVCDYQVWLQAMGVDVTGLRAMGAAESQMALEQKGFCGARLLNVATGIFVGTMVSGD